MAVNEQPQTALDELVVDDPELEKALEKREAAKAARRTASKAFDEADVVARASLGELEAQLGEGPVRVGRFVLELRESAPKAVSFETEAKTRIAIRTST